MAWFNNGILDGEALHHPANSAQVIQEIAWAIQERYEAYNQPTSSSKKAPFHYAIVKSGLGDINYSPEWDLAWKPDPGLSQFDLLYHAVEGGAPVEQMVSWWRQCVEWFVAVDSELDIFGFAQDHQYCKADWSAWADVDELLADAGHPGGWTTDYHKQNPVLWTQFHDVLALLQQYTVTKKIYVFQAADNVRYGLSYAAALVAAPSARSNLIEVKKAGSLYSIADDVRCVVLFDGYSGAVQNDLEVEWALRTSALDTTIRLDNFVSPILITTGTFGAWETATIRKEDVVLGSDWEIYVYMHPTPPASYPGGSIQIFPLREDSDEYRVRISDGLTYG